ncbi:MAG: HD domain-containing protein [Candidatus Solibacter usitatus]|nr:HD domain-containing protein [Candidatus Solibacter usitatus]
MKSPYVRELEPNQTVTTSFLVRAKEIREKKTGEPYLSMSLGDRTGEIEAKMWDNVVDVMETFERDDFVKVKGLIQVYHNRQQLTIHKMRRMEDGEVDFADYFPASTRNREEMFAELLQFVRGIHDPHLQALVQTILNDPEIARRYALAPAAKQIHHAYLGGLVEHVLSLCHLARMVSVHYPSVDPDLLMAGVILHDIGKIYELSYDRSFGYSTEGQLLGHMVIGLRIIADALRALPDFPPRLRTLLEHMIVSHHGRLEFGSPKLPQFPEALMLHYLDDMDSKMECMRALVENDKLVDGHFTVFNGSLERVVLKKANGASAVPGQTESGKLKCPEPPQPARFLLRWNCCACRRCGRPVKAM